MLWESDSQRQAWMWSSSHLLHLCVFQLHAPSIQCSLTILTFLGPQTSFEGRWNLPQQVRSKRIHLFYFLLHKFVPCHVQSAQPPSISTELALLNIRSLTNKLKVVSLPAISFLCFKLNIDNSSSATNLIESASGFNVMNVSWPDKKGDAAAILTPMQRFECVCTMLTGTYDPAVNNLQTSKALYTFCWQLQWAA